MQQPIPPISGATIRKKRRKHEKAISTIPNSTLNDKEILPSRIIVYLEAYRIGSLRSADTIIVSLQTCKEARIKVSEEHYRNL
jgi:hypothetical protein